MRPIAWRRRALAAGSLAALLSAGAGAGAWESTGKWDVHVVQYWINPANHDVTDAQAISAMRFGATAWTKQTRAAFRFAYQGTTSTAAASYDSENVVLFRDTGDTVHATAYTWRIGTEIVEGDIVFWDTPNAYIAGSTACTLPQIYIENVAIHEFGHVLGLDHTPVDTATMHSHSPGCDKSRYVLDPDDIAGAEALYPCSASSQCNDANVCTTDVCQSTKCSRTAIAGCCNTNADCNDTNACTTDKCVTNKCTNTAVPDCCTTNAQCNDANACTTDKCVANECTNTAVPDCCTTNAQCNDANACTTDKCVANECTNTAVPDCCTTNAQCNDANACTTDTCAGNVCTNTAVPDCCTSNTQCDDANACTTDTCAGNACTNTAVPDCCTTNAQCDDGDPCTTDVCQANTCVNDVIAGCCQGDAGQDGSAAEAGAPDGSAEPDAKPGQDAETGQDAKADQDSSVGQDAGPDRDGALDGAAGDKPTPSMTGQTAEDGPGCSACAVKAQDPVSPWAPFASCLAVVAVWLRRRRRSDVLQEPQRNECGL